MATKSYEEAVKWFAKNWRGARESAILVLSNLYDVDAGYVSRDVQKAHEAQGYSLMDFKHTILKKE